MRDYSSVKNTAKNGKLIRAEIREYILAMALTYGLYQNKEWSDRLYPDNPHRQEQCTLFFIPNSPNGLNSKTTSFHKNLIKTFASYFKKLKEDFGPQPNESILFYDTKKFRIYYDRLRYGRKQSDGEYKVNLHRTMQYMWTPILMTMLYVYGYDKERQAINLNNFWFFKESWNIEDTVYRLSDWVIHIGYEKTGYLGEFKYSDDGYLNLDNPEAWRKAAYENIDFITKKLIEGKYI